MSAVTAFGVPRGPLMAAGLAISLAIALAIAGRMESAARPSQSSVLAERSLNFADGPDNTVIVKDAATGKLVSKLVVGQDNFLRVTMHTLATARARSGIGQKPPFTLTRYEDGRLELADPATGRQIDLEAFGPTNEANFAPLLTTEETAR